MAVKHIGAFLGTNENDIPTLSESDWFTIKELVGFLKQFKDINNPCIIENKSSQDIRALLGLECLIVTIHKDFLSVKETLPADLKYAAESSYAKLWKYYGSMTNKDYLVAVIGSKMQARYLCKKHRILFS